MAKKGSSGAGRPTVMTTETINRLEEAFSLGCGDLEACFYANISATALYEYQRANPEFAQRKAILKEKTIFKARAIVEKAIAEGDKDMAKWYLERKKKEEFSTKVEGGGNNMGVVIQVASPDQVKLANNQIDALINGSAK